MGDLSEKIVENIDKLENNNLIKAIEKIVPKFSLTFQSFIGLKNLIFIDEIDALDHKKFKMKLEDPYFMSTFINIYQACQRSKEEEKSRFFCKFFRTIVENEINNKSKFDELEEFIYLFSTLSYREILAVHKIREFTLANSGGKTEENSIFLKNPSEWTAVCSFLEEKLNMNSNYIYICLSKLARTGLIIKNKQMQSNLDPQLRTSEDPINRPNSIDSYLSTSYFEIIYKFSDDLENYLNKCIKD